MLPTPAILPEIPAAQIPPRQAAGHRDYLDGLRALAALWVVLSHIWIIPCGMAARESLVGRLTNWTLYSHFAVDIFLVLSGFCLILPVARDEKLRGGALPFFLRRARRILPPFYAALVLSVGVALVIQALGDQPVQVNRNALLANVLLVQDLFQPLNIFNGPFWSIAVEWRIYFLFPMMVWVLPHCGRRGLLVLAALAGGAATVALQRLHPEMILACPWYLLLFALGLCAGLTSSKAERPGEQRFWPVLCLVSMAGLAALVRVHPITTLGGGDFGSILPVADTIAGIGVAAGLLVVSRSPHWFPLLSWRPLVTLGTSAYSLYLVHMPCLLLMNKLLLIFVPTLTDLLHRAIVLLCTLPLVIAFARLFFLGFERPFLSRKSSVEK